jgi:hypothetical protein
LDQERTGVRRSNTSKISLRELWLLRFEDAEGRSPGNDESHRCEGGHATPDLGLGGRQRKGGERFEVLVKISVIDRGRSRRTVDLVEEAKFPKQE